MISFKDQTFCASPDCIGSCGRKLSEQDLKDYAKLNSPDQWDGILGIAYGYFCGAPEEDKNETIHEGRRS